MAERIPGARLIELPGDDHLPFVGDQDQILDEVEGFLTGFRPGEDSARVLATVLSGRLEPRNGLPAGAPPPARLVAVVARHVEHFRGEALRIDGRDVQAAFDGPARAIRCAVTIADTAARAAVVFRSASGGSPGTSPASTSRRASPGTSGASRSKSQWPRNAASRWDALRIAVGAAAQPTVSPGEGYGEPWGTPRMATSAWSRLRSVSMAAPRNGAAGGSVRTR